MDGYSLVRVILLCVLATGGTGKASAQTQSDDLPRATIRVSVFDPFGARIENPNLYLYTLDRKQNLANDVSGLIIKDVPYGSYILVVASSGGGVGQRLVAVNTRDVWLRIGVSMPVGDTLWPGGDLAIVGEIKPTPQDPQNWWIRVEGVFLNGRTEAPVQKQGTFRVAGLEMGTYLVEVFEGVELKQIRSIEIDPNTPVTRLTISLTGPKLGPR